MVSNRNQNVLYLADKLNDASIDRVMAINTQWEIIAWNKTTEMISGIKKEEALGKHLIEVFPQLQQDAEITQAYQSALQGKKSFLPAKANFFNRSYYENHFIPLFDDDNHIMGAMNIMHDVSHRIKAERQLQQLHVELKEKYRLLEKANAEMATFTSITGNDLKEPIKKVYTTLEMIMMTEGAQLSNSSKAGLRRIQASLNRIKLLLDDILAISNISSFNTSHTRVNLQQLMQNVIGALNAKIKEKEAFVQLNNLPVIPGSEQMLFNLFYNLLDNALKFQPANNIPIIVVSGSTMPGEAGEAGEAGDTKKYACINVADNGIGFEPHNAEKIFNMFERLHTRQEFPGSGIGLTIARKIADAHGGYITAESTPGRGSTFHCYFPL